MFKSFKGRLIGLIVFIMFTTGVVNFMQFKHALNGQSEDILKSFNIHSEAIANAIAAQFYERYGDVQAFARNDGLLNLDSSNIEGIFNEYAKLYGIYDVILLVDLQGKYIASNTILPDASPLDSGPLKTMNFSNEPWFRSVLNGQFTEEPAKALTGTYVEDAHVDPITTAVLKKEQFGNSFTAIFKDKQGKPLGIITNRANFKWVELEAQISYRALKARGLATAEVTVISKDGSVIVDYDPTVRNGNVDVQHDFAVLNKLNLAEKGLDAAKQLVAGKSGSQLAKHIRKGVNQIVGFSKIESPKMLSSMGWGTMVRVDADEVFSVINNSQRLFYLISAVMFVLFGLLVWLLSSKIAAQIGGITHKISEAGLKVSSAGSQLSMASQQVSSGSSEAAASLEETVSSIEELSSMVKLNADNAKQAKALSQTSTKSAEEGETEIRGLITSMKEIAKSSKKIEEIINVIDDIAFQTNLLALNAAVEAARAGEQGKGFAVVAEAVRNLAQRSASAAKDITSLIKDSVSQIDQGTKVADASGNVLKNIVTSVKKVSDLNNEIASASAEQANGISQISKAMNELDRSTQQNASASEEVAGAATQMSSQADTLKTLVSDLTIVIEGVASRTVIKEEPKASPPRQGSITPISASRKHSSKPKNEEVEKMIPFNDETAGKLGTTDGF